MTFSENFLKEKPNEKKTQIKIRKFRQVISTKQKEAVKSPFFYWPYQHIEKNWICTKGCGSSKKLSSSD